MKILLPSIIYNKDPSSRNTFGIQQGAASWQHPKSGPPIISMFVKIRNKFGLTRPTTTLTKEAWPNPPKGPPASHGNFEAEEADAFINDLSGAAFIFHRVMCTVITTLSSAEIEETKLPTDWNGKNEWDCYVIKTKTEWRQTLFCLMEKVELENNEKIDMFLVSLWSLELDFKN